jgi:hypothetical protein
MYGEYFKNSEFNTLIVMQIINEIIALLSLTLKNTSWFTLAVISIWMLATVYFSKKHHGWITSIVLSLSIGCLVYSSTYSFELLIKGINLEEKNIHARVAKRHYLAQNESHMAYSGYEENRIKAQTAYDRPAKEAGVLILIGVTLLGLVRKPWLSLVKTVRSTRTVWDDSVIVLGVFIASCPIMFIVFGASFPWWIKLLGVTYTIWCVAVGKTHEYKWQLEHPAKPIP